MARTIVFFDWDNTLVDFPHAAGLAAMEQFLRGKIGHRATQNLTRSLDFTFWARRQLYLKGERYVLFDAIRNVIAPAIEGIPQPDMLEESREAWLLLAEHSYLLWRWRIPRSIMAEAADVYWEALGAHAKPDPWALWCVGLLKERACALAIATASDVRLLWHKRHWRYDPALSAKKKRARVLSESFPLPRTDEKSYMAEIKERMMRTRKLLGSWCETIVTGDPLGKTHPDFWKNALKEVHAQRGDRLFMIGDNYEADIVPASNANIFTILVDKTGRYPDPARVPAANRVVHRLDEIPNYVLEGGFP